jgi:RNA polymerase sigma-70 factor (ECF subfamily)
MISDEHLMLDFQRGSREAFSELFERYREPVYGFFRRRLQNAPRAEELTQETFLAVLRGAGKYEPRATFRTYLYSIAFRQISGEWRRAKREVAVAESEPATVSEPGDVIWLRRAVEQLDPAHREVLLLREYEELSYEEIAAVLRVPVNTVRSRLFRSRMELKSLLSPERFAQRDKGREGSHS